MVQDARFILLKSENLGGHFIRWRFDYVLRAELRWTNGLYKTLTNSWWRLRSLILPRVYINEEIYKERVHSRIFAGFVLWLRGGDFFMEAAGFERDTILPKSATIFHDLFLANFQHTHQLNCITLRPIYLASGDFLAFYNHQPNRPLRLAMRRAKEGGLWEANLSS